MEKEGSRISILRSKRGKVIALKKSVNKITRNSELKKRNMVKWTRTATMLQACTDGTKVDRTTKPAMTRATMLVKRE